MRNKLIGWSAASMGVLVLLCVWAWNAWEYQSIGTFHTRRHLVRGIVEVERAGKYVEPFAIDPQATALTPAELATIKLSEITWGEHGLLCLRVTTAPGKPIKGRLVFSILITETRDGKRIRDRSLRTTVDWPAGTSIEIVLSTDLSKPIRNQQTHVRLEPVL